eukprot:CAMPEP_0174821954 /NCGR_PEP_ID=MMETSP1107-20130205/11622_1 /TAXON_ID=36770 /ORGANISM="Paraphysomonas vestita, Strain GFlagA" /LENGTH=850 /DNA_ID=CAMNT_0016039639 /DNA_START=216 /DNA_END=2768 /DNA_ORIENTATION=-
MEEFKICEKETKTKAFSKEGLAREEKLNPREVEREEKKVWIQTVVERIEGVVESLEAELERVSNLKGKGKNKDQMDKLEARITTNRWHISKLEQINRLLDNDVLEPSKLDSIKEELDYYLECIDNEDAIVGMESDEYNIYEELQLDLLSLGGPGFGKGEDDEEKEGDSKLSEELSPMIEPLAADEASIPVLTSVPSNSSSSTTTTTSAATSSTTSANVAKSKKVATTTTTAAAAINTTNSTTTPSTTNSTSSTNTPNVTLPTTNSSNSSSSTTTTTTATTNTTSSTSAQNKLASVISSVGTKTAASVVANSSAQAKTVPTGAKSVVAPSTQKSTPTAASIVASNIPTNPSTVAGTKTQPTPALTAAKIVAGEKKVPAPTTTQTKPVENRKDPSGPTPTVTSPPLTGSWAHAATSGQRIGIGSGNSPSPKQTTPKQSTLSTPPVIPPVESLPQAVTQVSETSSSTSTSANSKTNEVSNNNNNNTSSSTTTTTPATTTAASIAASSNNSSNTTSASSVTPSTTASNPTPSTNVANNNNNTATATNNNNNTNTTTAAAIVASNSNNGGVSNSSLQSKTLDSETQVVKPQVNSSPALNPKTTSSPVLNSVSNSNEPPSLTSLSLEENNKGSNGIPPLHKLTPIQQPQQSPATQPSVTLSPGPSQSLPPPYSNLKSSNPSNSGEIHNPQTIAMLKQSMAHLPPNDFERKAYVPRTPYPGTLPASFPTQQLSIVDNPALFERLPMDTLFFAFYYQQGAHQQYLAARQLKKHSWRYHKKYMTWFQRHEEPKTTTSDYEEGTYVYFDYESGWCQRIKSEFKFEYAYLEDELPQAGVPSSKDPNIDPIQAGRVRLKYPT